MRWIALALVLAASTAFAHGDATWIKERHPRCCGPKDCAVVRARDVQLTAAGWTVAGYGGTLPRADVKQSIDRRWWACEWPWGEIRCLFRPPTPAWG